MIDKNDPRLTAYALGELEAPEAAAFEAALATEADARAELDDIRRAASELRLALADESAPALTDGQREVIRASAVHAPAEGRFGPLRVLAWTLTAAAACAVIGITLNPYADRGERSLSLAQQVRPQSSAPTPYSEAGRTPERTDSYSAADQAPEHLGRPVRTTLAEAVEAPAEPTASSAAPTEIPALLAVSTAPATAPAVLAVPASPPAAPGAAVSKGMDDLVEATLPRSPERAPERAAPRALRAGTKVQPPVPVAGAMGPGMGMAGQSAAGEPVLEKAGPGMPAAAQPAGGAAAGMAGPALLTAARPAAAAADRVTETAFTLEGGGTAGALEAPIVALKIEALTRRREAGAATLGTDLRRDTEDAPPDRPFRSATEAPLSTVPVGTLAETYGDIRNFLMQGQLPPRSAVHIESLVNHFRYADEDALSGLPYNVRTEVAACPWKPDQRLVRIAVTCGRQAVGGGQMAGLGAVAMGEAAAAAAAPAAAVVEATEDVRLQVEFSPAHVAFYRLIANDTGRARESRDRDPTVGQIIRPGVSVNAFYQVIPAPAETVAAAMGGMPVVAADEGRGAQQTQLGDELGVAGNLLTVTLRWPPAGAGDAGVLQVPVPDQPQAWEVTSPDMQFGSAVALFGMLLRQSPYAAGATFDTVLTLAAPVAGQDAAGERAEFLELVRKAKQTQAEPPR